MGLLLAWLLNVQNFFQCKSLISSGKGMILPQEYSSAIMNKKVKKISRPLNP